MPLCVVDDRGKTLILEREPERVVSLVPSDSYNLVLLGAGPRLVGRTAYCVEPAADLETVTVVGGTKNADVERVIALEPDLVIANQEENRRHDIDALERAGVPVLLSFPTTVAAGLDHVVRLAALFPSCAELSAPPLAEATATLERRQAVDEPPIATFVPIWMDPLMTIHGDTFISDALALAGGCNVFADRERRYPLAADLGEREAVASEGRDLRYPRVTFDEVVARAPDLVLLPDEPHEFSAADAEVFRALPMAPLGVHFCNGRDLMWYGLRAVEGLERIARLVAEARRHETISGAQ
jgi:ABC-type Fe3+-hydroxamate transport system substrate-binding protein